MIHNNPNNSRISKKKKANYSKSYSLIQFYHLKKCKITREKFLDTIFIFAAFLSLVCTYFIIQEFVNLRDKINVVLGDDITLISFLLKFHKYKDMNLYGNYFIKKTLQRKINHITDDVQNVCVIDSGSKIGNFLKYVFSFDILFSCSKSVTQQSITSLMSSSKRELMLFIDGILYSLYHIQRLSIRAFTLGNSSLIYLICQKRRMNMQKKDKNQKTIQY